MSQNVNHFNDRDLLYKTVGVVICRKINPFSMGVLKPIKRQFGVLCCFGSIAAK